MKIPFLKILTVTIFLFIITSITHASAATYYISPSGNDTSGNGSVGTPWKTLRKACTTVSGAGDIIHVNAGTYTETQQCFLAVGVSIEGDSQTTSIIKSTINGAYIPTIDARSAEGTNGNQHISNIKFDGNNLAADWAIWIGGRSNVSVHDVTIVDFYNLGITFGGRIDGQPLPPTIYATGNTFYNNTIHNSALYDGYGRGALNIGGQDGMLVYNNTITQVGRPSGQNGWPIKYTNEGHTKGLKIYNNILTKAPFAADGWSFCLELFNGEGTEIYGNTIQGSIDLNYSDPGTTGWTYWIHDNLFTQPALNSYNEEGIIFEFSFEGVTIEDNIFENIHQGIVSDRKSVV